MKKRRIFLGFIALGLVAGVGIFHACKKNETTSPSETKIVNDNAIQKVPFILGWTISLNGKVVFVSNQTGAVPPAWAANGTVIWDGPGGGTGGFEYKICSKCGAINNFHPQGWCLSCYPPPSSPAPGSQPPSPPIILPNGERVWLELHNRVMSLIPISPDERRELIAFYEEDDNETLRLSTVLPAELLYGVVSGQYQIETITGAFSTDGLEFYYNILFVNADNDVIEKTVSFRYVMNGTNPINPDITE